MLVSSDSGQHRRIVVVGGPAAAVRFSVGAQRRVITHDQARIPTSRCTLAP
ncbi:MAG: hypothetical protein R2909_04300 [Gemmatimonadales bacterium]